MTKVVNICDLLDILFGEDWTKHPSYEEQSKVIVQWCRDSGAHLYSRPKEDFFIHEAIEEARNQSKSVVVVEDLS